MLCKFSNNFIQRQVLVTLMILFSLLVQCYIKGAIFFAHSCTVISNNNERIVQAHTDTQTNMKTWYYTDDDGNTPTHDDESRTSKISLSFSFIQCKDIQRGGFSLVIMTSFSAAFFYRLHTAPQRHNALTLQLIFGRK